MILAMDKHPAAATTETRKATAAAASGVNDKNNPHTPDQMAAHVKNMRGDPACKTG